MTPEEILQEQGIEYTVKGKDLILSCLSPSHEDSNPSMHIDKTIGIGQCFSCKAKINLYTRFNKIINTLTIRQQSILDMITELDYTKLVVPDDAQIFDMDYRNISAETYNEFGAFTSETEFEGRVVLPINNFKGDIVAFIGRFQYSKLDPKYLVRPHGKALPLYPSALTINSDSIILVEGIFDMLNLYDKGVTNVVCGFGLVSPSKKDKYNVKLHERFMPYKIAGITTLYILYDGDKYGKQASTKLEEALEEFMIVETIDLPEGLDPGDMSQEQVDNLKGIINGRST